MPGHEDAATRVKPGTRVDLSRSDPDADGGYDKGDDACDEKLQADLDSMTALQERLYAEDKQSLLIVLQAMDAGGKDGTIRHVMGAFNPQSCYVAGFKAPTPRELAHDYLWRIHQRTPARGEIAVFNRSHYEDVLIVRVHNLVPPEVWKRRYDQINAFEELLTAGGTRIIKLFLHISKDEQRERLQKRIDNPEKHWKINPADFEERALWDEYMEAYQEALSRCSTDHAPWHIIPANHKWYRNLVAADIIEKALRDMDPQWPEPKTDISKLRVR